MEQEKMFEMEEEQRHQRGGTCLRCLKYFMIILNAVLLAAGIGVLALGVMLVLRRVVPAEYIVVAGLSGLSGDDLFVASYWILLVVGIGIIITSVVGIVAAIKESAIIAILYAILMSIFAIALIIAVILAVLSRTQLEQEPGAEMGEHMEKTLTNEYGRDDRITYSWNITQERLGCCAVDSNGWSIYRTTPWFKDTPLLRDSQSGITGSSGDALRMFVPPQCCNISALTGNPEDKRFQIEQCTTREDRPPGLRTGRVNNALHYRGCYFPLKEIISEFSSLLGMYMMFIKGAGIAVSLLNIGCVVLASLFYMQLKRRTRSY